MAVSTNTRSKSRKPKEEDKEREQVQSTREQEQEDLSLLLLKKNNNNHQEEQEGDEEEEEEEEKGTIVLMMKKKKKKKARRIQRTTHQKSVSFHFIRYPILLGVGFIISVNIVVYTSIRILVQLGEWLFSNLLTNRLTKSLERNLSKNSKNYQEWLKAAKDLDRNLNLEEWKWGESEEIFYDEELVLKITRRLAKVSEEIMNPTREGSIEIEETTSSSLGLGQLGGSGSPLSDTLLLLPPHLQTPGALRIKKLMLILSQSACKQDLGGVENPILYSRCYSGPKVSVDTYVEQVVQSLELIFESKDVSWEEKSLFFKQVSVIFGRSALCLSGGATLGYFHLGVMKALWEENLLPSIITGTSAGAMMAAMVAVRTDEELKEIFDPSIASKIHCLSNTWIEMLTHYWRTGALISDEKFREDSSYFTKGDTTFEEAYLKTGRILNVSVMSSEGHTKSKMLNYINSPNITIRSAVVASSAIPGLLPACNLYSKDPKTGKVSPYLSSGTLWRDGSLKSDIPETDLQQLFRVKYTIVSQVNPHVALFFYRPRGHPGNPISGQKWRGGFIFSSILRLLILEVNKWLSFVRDMEVLPRISGANWSNLFTQSFEGSLTLIPQFRWWNYFKIMTDPDEQRLGTYFDDGSRATWPAMSALSNRMKIEQAISKYLLASRRFSR